MSYNVSLRRQYLLRFELGELLITARTSPQRPVSPRDVRFWVSHAAQTTAVTGRKADIRFNA